MAYKQKGNGRLPLPMRVLRLIAEQQGGGVSAADLVGRMNGDARLSRVLRATADLVHKGWVQQLPGHVLRWSVTGKYAIDRRATLLARFEPLRAAALDEVHARERVAEARATLRVAQKELSRARMRRLGRAMQARPIELELRTLAPHLLVELDEVTRFLYVRRVCAAGEIPSSP